MKCCSKASTVDAEMFHMVETIAQVGKEIWTDIIFIIVIHLLLLSLYAFVYCNLFHFSMTSKPQYPSTNLTILGACI